MDKIESTFQQEYSISDHPLQYMLLDDLKKMLEVYTLMQDPTIRLDNRGICSNTLNIRGKLGIKLSSSFDRMRIQDYLFKSFTDGYPYPVHPCNPSMEDYEQEVRHHTSWNNPLRIKLLDHCITELKKVIALKESTGE